jgi:hypothetical protein
LVLSSISHQTPPHAFPLATAPPPARESTTVPTPSVPALLARRLTRHSTAVIEPLHREKVIF